MNYTLLDHNADFVVVNKQGGVQVHAPQHEGEQSVQQQGLLQQVAKDLGLPRLYPVHRLDADTSGVLVMACTEMANRTLSMAFAARAVSKLYLAVSDRKGSKKQGLVAGDMEKSRRGSWKLTQGRRNPAITQFFSQTLAPGKRLFLLKPHTGKTHQLRVMMRALAAPILGDDRYGGTPADRLYLHAWQLQFPWQDQLLTYTALPEAGEWFADEQLQPCLASWRDEQSLNWPALPRGLLQAGAVES